MSTTDLLTRIAIAAAISHVLAGPLLAQTQPAAEKAESATQQAVEACEKAVQDLLATKGTPVADVKFAGAPTSQPRLSGDGQIALQGAGSWRTNGGVNTFAYTCNVNAESFEVAGVVMRDTSPSSANKASAKASSLEPNLTNISPEACESSVAAILRKRWPRVSEISFESTTRQLNQAGPNATELHGQGRALASPGAAVSHFSFDCEFDSRNGRILNTKVSK